VYLYSSQFCSTHTALSHGSHSFTCNYTNASLYLVSVHRMAPSQTEVADIWLQPTILIYLLRKDERLSRPGWLTYSGRFIHVHTYVNSHPSAAGRTQDSESSPVEDQRSTTVPRNQLNGQPEALCRPLKISPPKGGRHVRDSALPSCKILRRSVATSPTVPTQNKTELQQIQNDIA